MQSHPPPDLESPAWILARTVQLWCGAYSMACRTWSGESVPTRAEAPGRPCSRRGATGLALSLPLPPVSGAWTTTRTTRKGARGRLTFSDGRRRHGEAPMARPILFARLPVTVRACWSGSGKAGSPDVSGLCEAVVACRLGSPFPLAALLQIRLPTAAGSSKAGPRSCNT